MNTFRSLLFPNGVDFIRLNNEMPACFNDLHLDKITDAITYGKDEYNIKPWFYTALTDPKTICYRQAVWCDIEQNLWKPFQHFSDCMKQMHAYQLKSIRFYYKYQQEKWFLDAVTHYCNAVSELYDNLLKIPVCSEGILLFRNYLEGYLQSEDFLFLQSESAWLQNALQQIRYCVHIQGLCVQVMPVNNETDYSREIEDVFAKFREDDAKNYLVHFPYIEEMNHVEASILDGVAWLFPWLFDRLNVFCDTHLSFTDLIIERFDREIQFYLSYSAYIGSIRKMGYSFCIPTLSITDKAVFVKDSFDLSMAKKFVQDEIPVVTNDFYLQDKERIIVVSGPNQGGKTTFARTFGQLHYLACLGLCVPGSEAKLFVPDRIFTHFEKEEDIKNLRGNLQDDLYRMHEILNEMSQQSIVILNEIFNSTTLSDQIFLSKKIMKRLTQLNVLGVWVTFIGELASYSDETVSMVSSIHPDNPVLRTYKIQRHAPDDLIYAMSIAEKYRLTYNQLKSRLSL